MKVKQLQIPKEQAEEEYRAYKEACKNHKDAYLRDLKALYGHMRHGRAIIDIFDAFKRTGLNENEEPKLAIVVADAKHCRFEKHDDGGGLFYTSDYRLPKKKEVHLPAKTFCEQWKKEPERWNPSIMRIANRNIQTTVPIIPARILNPIKYALKNYYVLWEVKEWKPVPPRDPILLKRLTPNMFVVLATWNLTKIERAVIKGRIE